MNIANNTSALDLTGVPAMRMIHAAPPNFAKILKAFPHASRPGVFFCYGPAVYSPTGAVLTKALIAHEAVHALRQEQVGGPEIWWERYIEDKPFRFEEELVAHREEYRVLADGKARPERRHHLREVAARLSGPLYGRMATEHEARRLIMVGAT